MSKVSVIGAGNVGATCVHVLANMNVASQIVLLDIKEGLAEGKAMDMMQTVKMSGFTTTITGVTNQYEAVANSDVVVVTSGIARKPGMTREELIGTNAGIVESVVKEALKYAPNAIIIVISNPMDTMTYLTLKSSGIDKSRIIGMGGILDSNRFSYYLSGALNVKQSQIDAMVIGGHGDTTMIPLVSKATMDGTPVSEKIDKVTLDKVVADTMTGGATLTKLIGTSAWYAPGTAGALLVKSILLDEKKIYPCSVALDGEYNQSDVCIGVPVCIGKNGVEKIIQIELNESEKELFEKSAAAVRGMNNVLKDLNLI
ncbi:MAG: malate dehydrogenase [Prevotellaceae bacterium]|jgi:malate dehydrogenase|nr:malate dehydrogenase [Prevotellaceae bacterium]